MHKDFYFLKIKKLIKNLNINTNFYVKNTFIFYKYKDKFKIIKKNKKFKKNLNVYTYTKIKIFKN
jgi:hypothetical protein